MLCDLSSFFCFSWAQTNPTHPPTTASTVRKKTLSKAKRWATKGKREESGGSHNLPKLFSNILSKCEEIKDPPIYSGNKIKGCFISFTLSHNSNFVWFCVWWKNQIGQIALCSTQRPRARNNHLWSYSFFSSWVVMYGETKNVLNTDFCKLRRQV